MDFFFFFLDEEEQGKSLQTDEWGPWINASSFLSFSLTSFPKLFLFSSMKVPKAGTAASVHRIRQGADTGDTAAGWESSEDCPLPWGLRSHTHHSPGNQSVCVLTPAG